MMSVTIFGFGASFATYTFITPMLTDVTGFNGATANLLLMVFGLATLIGNLVGGQLASKVSWYSTLRWKLVALVFTLIAIMHAISNAHDRSAFCLGSLGVWCFSSSLEINQSRQTAPLTRSV
ncbi:hypothetical protein [Pseudomonas xanthosomatis]|uniref:hypothetical protein n=1 Tax=Pseudomonas xanthosomatis TaxID=2842356 RepID=UPI003514CFE2